MLIAKRLVGLCNFMHYLCMDLDALILQLLDDSPIADQGDLLTRLEAQGHELTQSTLSRRLRRLGVLKVQGRYRRVEPNAQTLRLSLDADPLPGQMGTIAGDDTVFLAVLPERLAEVKAQLVRALARG